MSIDWTKPIQTKSGQPARLLGTYHPNVSGETHCVAITLGDGPAEYIKTYWANGNYCRNGTSTSDLENIPEPPKYRPYTAEETRDFVGAMFVRKGDKIVMLCTAAYVTGNFGFHCSTVSPEELMDEWEHLDGSPCGVLEEE